MIIKRIIKRSIPFLNVDNRIYSLYRRSHLFKSHLYIKKYFLYKMIKKYNCHISPAADIEQKINMPHPIGIVIGDGVKIGKNVTIFQNVTIGRKNKDVPSYPIIDDDVIIYCNSVIIGNIKIGKGAIIGANSIVLRDVKENETVFGIVK